jgi:4-amino-4-deoxy-L-arabinose transferase-like glycosyltransferase
MTDSASFTNNYRAAARSLKRWQPLAPEALVAMGIVIAAALSLYRIDQKSFWLDEATTYFVSGVSWSRLLEVVSGDATGWHPPTYFLALKAWRAVAGDSQVALRSFSVLFAVLTIPMVYVVARRLAGRWPAALGSLLLACNALFIQHAQDARTYSLTMFLAVASYVLFLRAIAADSNGRWLAYAGTSVLGIYSHAFFAFLVGAQLLSMALPGMRPNRIGPPILGFAAVSALTVPLIVASLGRAGSVLGWVDSMSWDRLAGWFTESAGGTDALVMGYGTALALAIVWAAGPGRRPGWLGLILLWAIVPPLGLALASLVKPVFLTRYLTISLPAIVVLVAVGISRLPSWAATVMVGLLLLGSAFGVSAWYSSPTREWDKAAIHLQQHARRGDAVALWRGSWYKPLAYQVTRLPAATRPRLASPARPWTMNPYGRGDPPTTAAAGDLRRCSFRRIWLVGGPRRLQPGTRGEQRVLGLLLRDAYEETDSLLLGRLRLQLFVRNADSPCPDFG